MDEYNQYLERSTTQEGSDRRQMQGIIIKVCKDLGFKSEDFRRYCDWCDWKFSDEKTNLKSKKMGGL